MGHWQLEQNKILVTLNYSAGYLLRPPAIDEMWTTNPKSVRARSSHPNQNLDLPMHAITSLETLDLTNLVIEDIGVLLSQLPNVKHLTLNQVTIGTSATSDTAIALPNLETLHLESSVDLSIVWAISSKAPKLAKVPF